MEAYSIDPALQIKRLQLCMNNLVSVLALPAVWAGRDLLEIVTTCMDSLLGLLDLDFLYARVRVEIHGEPIEVLRVNPSRQPRQDQRAFTEALNRWLSEDHGNSLDQIRLHCAGEEISTFHMQIGIESELGMIVAGTRRSTFPEQTEKLVLSVAANQAAIGLQQARVLSEQKRVAKELDERVTQKTRELAAANEQLKRAGRESRLIIDTIPTVVWCMRPDGTNEFISKVWNEYTGVPSEEVQGWGWQASFHPDDLPHLMKNWREALASGEPAEAEARLRRRDGIYRWFLMRACPFRDESGMIVRWYGTSTDIEDRKRAEEAVLASERNLRLIIDTMPVLAWSAWPDGRVDFFNQRWLDYTGLSSTEAENWGWAQAFHPDDMSRFTDYWESRMGSGKPGEIEARLRRFDGNYRWFIIRADPLRDDSGAIVKWYGTNTDIEDRKQTEQELLRKEAFLAKAQRLSLSGSFSWRVDVNEVTFSEGARRIFEFELDTLVTLEQITGLIHPDDRSLMMEMVRGARGPGGDQDYGIRLQMPDGSVKHLRVSSQETRDRNGPREYVGAIQDVTAYHFAQEALDKARSELAHVSRVTSLSTMTASIAHEINQPLSGIITNANTCLRMLGGDSLNIEGARETARRTIRDGNRVSDVIARLRKLFSRREIVAEPVDLNEATREVIALLRSELQRKGTVLRCEFADRLPIVNGDRIQLQQVILNLVRNASDAMTGIEDRPRRLLICTERADDSVRVVVRDSGIGFDPAMANRIFESFYTTKPEGMGIGLSVSRSIMEAHGGRLWATANDGPGATFAFSIPYHTLGEELSAEMLQSIKANTKVQ